MATKAIKISEENYAWISRIAGELQIERGSPVSLDQALTFMHKQGKITELAGKSSITHKEVKRTQKELKKGWSSFNKKYA